MPSPSAPDFPLVKWLTGLSARGRLGLAVLAGLATFWLSPADFHLGTRVVVAWDGFSVAYLLLVWAVVATADTARLRRLATRQDPGHTLTFVAVLLAVGASLLAVVLLLNGLKTLNFSERALRTALSMAAVLSSWLLLHTLFALRYAHAYFSEDLTTSPPDLLGGLKFPGDAPTTYWDFAYFSFVIGMTAQTSDTGVTSLRMRRMALIHGLLSFGFNTALVALTINVLDGII